MAFLDCSGGTKYHAPQLQLEQSAFTLIPKLVRSGSQDNLCEKREHCPRENSHSIPRLIIRGKWYAERHFLARFLENHYDPRAAAVITFHLNSNPYIYPLPFDLHIIYH